METQEISTIHIIKGLCILFVIMLHAVPEEGTLHKLLPMPFYAQLYYSLFHGVVRIQL